MMRLLRHPWLTLAARLTLGALFIWAALPKLADPPGFAKAIFGYQLFPAALIHPAALILPWLELLCGLALLLGRGARAAATWIALLLVTFLAALSINLARHHPVDCGCFGSPGQPRSQAERMASLRWDLLRDLGLLALALQLLATMKAGDSKVFR